MHKSNFRSFANYDYWLSLSWCSGSWKRSQCMMWKCVQSTGPFSFNTHWDRKWKLNNSFCPYYIQHPFKQEWAGKSFFLNFCFHTCISYIIFNISNLFRFGMSHFSRVFNFYVKTAGYCLYLFPPLLWELNVDWFCTSVSTCQGPMV